MMTIASNTCLKSNGKMTLSYVLGVAILIIAKVICLFQDAALNASTMKVRLQVLYLTKSSSLLIQLFTLPSIYAYQKMV